MKHILLLALLCLANIGFAQSDFTATVYFAKGKHALTAATTATLDSLAKALNSQKATYEIGLTGHASVEASSDFNQKLSEWRVEAVTAYLLQQGISSFKSTAAEGENQPAVIGDTEQILAKSRRVVLNVHFLAKATVEKPKRAVEKPIVKTEKRVEKDTAVQITMQKPIKKVKKEPTRCKIEDLPNCKIAKDSVCGDFLVEGDSLSLSKIAAFKTFCSPDSMESNQVFTYTTSGQPLVSGGMFEIKSADGKCFPKPIKVLQPIDTATWDKGMTLWNIDAKTGDWTPSKDKVRKVEIKGQWYIETTMKCPGRRNHDTTFCSEKLDFSTAPFSAYKIEDIAISFYNTNTKTSGRYGAIKIKKNKITVCVPCRLIKENPPQVSITAINKQGNLVRFKTGKLSKYANIWKPKSICLHKNGSKIERTTKLFGIFTRYKRGDRRHYTFNDSDFK
jgi:hypothetical protein